MPASVTFQRDTGAATGSPAKGTSRGNAGDVNWKNVDDIATGPSSAKIVAGNNSFEIFLFALISGTFTQLSNGLFAHTAGTYGAGFTLVGAVSSTYTTPSTSANAALTVDMTSPIAITSGEAVLFSTTGPEDASPTSTLSAAGYSQYMVTQLQTTAAASAGLTSTQTLSFQWDET